MPHRRHAAADPPALRRAADDLGFTEAVRRVIASIRPGEVATYGEVAREAGYEGAARAVGTLLARDGSDLPWWRIVTSTGRLVPGHEREHTRRLRAEGVKLAGTPARVRLTKQTPATTGAGRQPAARTPAGRAGD
jgi:alkylated DNA nucleotide flippase Atl1